MFYGRLDLCLLKCTKYALIQISKSSYFQLSLKIFLLIDVSDLPPPPEISESHNKTLTNLDSTPELPKPPSAQQVNFDLSTSFNTKPSAFPSPPAPPPVPPLLPSAIANNSHQQTSAQPSDLNNLPLPAPLSFDDEINTPLENKFADLTLTRPKKNKLLKNLKNSNLNKNLQKQILDAKNASSHLQNMSQQQHNHQHTHPSSNMTHSKSYDDNKSITSSAPSIPEDQNSQTSSNNTTDNHRNNLLAEIRKGKELRKVAREEQRQEMLNHAVETKVKDTDPNSFVNVANVLFSRRMFLKDSSDEEDTSTYGTGTDDDEW